MFKVNVKKADNVIAWAMAVSVLCLLPAYTTNGFFGSQEAKLRVLILTAAVGSLALLGVRVFALGNRLEERRNCCKFHMSKVEWALLIFLMGGFLSTLLSPFAEGAWTGFINGERVGRLQGYLVLLIYGLVFLIVSRKLKPKETLIRLFLIAGTFVSMLAVLNGYGIDPLGFYENVKESQRSTFVSTIGNINTFSSYAIITTTLCLHMFVKAKAAWDRYVYAALLFVHGAGLISAHSDSGIFGLTVTLSVMFLCCAHSRDDFKRLCKGCVFLFVIFSIIGFTNENIDGVWKTLSRNYIWVAAAMFFAVAYIVGKNGDDDVKRVRKTRAILTGCGGVVITLIVATNIFGIYLGGLDGAFKFANHWGSGRSEIYADTLEIYKSFDLKGYILGGGPDTYGAWTKAVGVSYGTTAHSEYLQYLVTMGIVGVASYLVFVISAIKCGLKSKNNITKGLAFAAFAYSVQAIFNINQIYTTPIFFMIISMIMAGSKEDYVPSDYNSNNDNLAACKES